jgi:hypothetical protein
MSKHTPGKWEITEDRLGVCVGLNNFLHPTESRVLTEDECEKEDVEPCDDYSIADCSGGFLARPSEECEANARLIAAAPELLDMLIELLAFPNNEPIREKARKIIAAAEGKE